MGETVQSVERAFAILEAFDEGHPSRTAAEIAETAGLARPTTYRMLQTLRQLGYVRHVGGRFELTPRVLRLGAGMLDGDDVITLAASSSPHSRLLAVAVQPGQRLPAERTSLGRVLLAHHRERSVDDAADIRSRGYALVDGQLETGLRSLGVPIRDHDGVVVAALAVAVNAARVTIEQLETDFLPALRATAESIGARA
jgi:IclR family pca regulon transcriptional regulator